MKIPQHVIDDANSDIVRVIGSYIQLKKNGGEYEACCPFHSEKTPSFKVNPNKKLFHCFGCGTSGDAVEFVMKHTGCQFHEAIEKITGNLPKNPIETRAKRDSEPPKWTALRHAPDDAPEPNFKHYKHGMPSAKWAYHDAQGNLVGYVCRFEITNEDGSKGKETIPITWAKSADDGKEAWRWLSFATPRPMLGLLDLIAKPSAKVLVVEGEKTREAAAKLFPHFAVVTWAGGGNAVGKTDFEPLKGRQVCFWPDFDHKKYKEPHPQAGQTIPAFYQSGVKAMFDIYEKIKDYAADCKIIAPADDSPCGWDLADDGWYDGFNAKEYAKNNIHAAADWFADEKTKADYKPPIAAAPIKTAVSDSTPIAKTDVNNAPTIFNVDIFSPLVDINSKGKPLSTIENMQEILRRIGVIARYNVINKQIELLIPNSKFSIDNQANAALAHVLSWVNRFGMSTGNVQDYITAIADDNQYNPVANWILSKEWDGTTRIESFFNTITEREPIMLADGRQLKDVLLMRWMVSCVAAVFNHDGISAHGVLVLQGDQYLGKTKWMKSLAPKELSVIKDGITLNPSDKDSVMQCVRNWIVELGELDATFRKSDIASLKSFITSDRDVLRRPYARLESEFARRTVFFASVNPKQFLHDPTGNRRFWTIECEHINHSHDIDMQQVWAEVYEQLYKKGVKYYLEPDEMAALNSRNESHTTDDPIQDMIDTAYNWLSPKTSWNFRSTATDICTVAGMVKPTKADINAAAQHVTKRYSVKTVYSGGRKYWLMPPKLNTFNPDPAYID